MSNCTSCDADNIGCTLEELMRSLASTTGHLAGGDTLAGGGADEAGESVNYLPATGARARRDRVSKDIRREITHRRHTCLVENGALFILAPRGIQAARYYSRCKALAPLSVY